ncbi:SusC/RagA family TonB-linked outer membrane protein [Sphingobacterium sp. UDSM-2020]|uniref:SusC/RagA family TonB-linked outer membrane protein n=1 Tax=Sphingobacterium sp. UDSM-2020 TaxID=2795738 RepID=UPI00193818EE|nr:TonB-dependent receptor [Sphingobacterium sp. UDSM-2020]QQD11653.1 TonB-dependent receptor [Sphingobacterium sp. UDSM-2020]
MLTILTYEIMNEKYKLYKPNLNNGILTMGVMIIASAIHTLPTFASAKVIRSNSVFVTKDHLFDFSIQQKIVTGIVTDEKGNVIQGASIRVKGTKNATLTNKNGTFELSSLPANAVLLISYVGKNSKEIPVNNQSIIDVVLTESASDLEEVVVVGYGTQKKVNLTGAVSSVSTEQIKNIPAGNLSNLIAGRAPGVTAVGTSGLAGASSSIRIRGSFAEPLYVINGIISGKADFDALDANEVETINFLKDAATASIYGSKAGNGVVLVTTKRGVSQKPVFEYKASFSTSSPTKPIQDYSAAEEIEFLNQVAVTKDQEKPYGQDIIDYFKDKSYNINDYIWQSPTVQQHNLSARGGSESILYYFSMGYHTEKGSYKNLGYDRYNFRSDVSAKITDRFKVSVNLSGNQRNYDRWYWPYDGEDDFNVGDFYRATFNWTRLYPFYVDENGNPTSDTKAFPVVPGAWHPIELMENSGSYRHKKNRNLDGIVRLDLDLSDVLKGLSTSLQGHYMASDRNSKAFVLHNKAYIFQSASTTNKFIPGPIDPTKVNIHNLSSTYPNINEQVNLDNSYQLNWNLKYENTFGNHFVSALGGYEQAGGNGKYLTGRADELLTTNIDQIYNTSSDILKRWFDGNESESARASWIGRFNYTYSDKYIAEVSFRYDGNYKFAPGKQWGFFPSASAAWRVSQEQFMKQISWLSDLKLRASYGSSGNDDSGDRPVAPFLWTQAYTKSSGFVFGSSLRDGLTAGPMPNPSITWSTSRMFDFGIDYGFFGQKLTGEIDFFKRTQSDILGARLASTPSTLGASLPDVNYAERSWKGLDFSVNWKNKSGNDFQYSFYANMGYAVDQWDIIDEAAALRDGTYQDNWRSAIGQPANRVYGLVSKGIIRTQEQLDQLPEGFIQYGRSPKLGYLLFEDIRGANFSEGPDGKIDDNDMTYLSDNGSPRINYGIGFNFEWKRFSLNAHFQGVGAYDRMVSTRNGGGVFQNDRPYFELWANNYWTPENPNAEYPRVSGEFQVADVGGGPSTFWIRNGAYIRLKNLDLAYALPDNWFKSIGLSRVQFYFNATNLFYLTGLKEHDPEQETLDSYPLMKTFTGGLNITF